MNLNKIINIVNNLDLVIAQPLNKKIDQAGNPKHINNFLWPKQSYYNYGWNFQLGNINIVMLFQHTTMYFEWVGKKTEKASVLYICLPSSNRISM